MRYQLLLISLAWTVLGGVFVSLGRAGDPGGFVLLQDRAVLPGVVTEEPGQIVIRQGKSEIRVARDRVACWAPSIAALHRYLIDTRKISDLRSHLDIARWCLQNDYPAGAVAELIAARRIDAENKEADLIETELRDWHKAREKLALGRAEEAGNLDATVSAKSAGVGAAEDQQTGDLSGGERLADNEMPGHDSQAAMPSLDELDGDELAIRLATFTKDIQPILLNRCGQVACHGAPSRQAYSLEIPRSYLGRPTSEMTRRNLEATMRWLDLDRAASSPLLVRALQPHAGLERAPLEPQNRDASDTLRRWVASLGKQAESTRMVEATAGGANAVAMQESGGTGMGKGSVGGPTRLPEVDDPFDPEVFNRRFHPDRRN